MDKKKRVVVAMSGGVDSSVAAALLVEQGYEVIGMMMRLWSEPGCEDDNRCCTPEQMNDARRIADQLGIRFYVTDVKDYFRKTIVDYFVAQYAAGNTPNPCIECNRHIRFEYLLDQAMALDADYLATGHYARIRHSAVNGYELWQGVDEKKDQSYVLHVMGQSELSRVLFPIGEYEKPKVRALAEQYNLNMAKKSDSQDLCFLGNDTYQNFLIRNAPEIAAPGAIVTLGGTEVGRHTGLPFYTIGQRKGLGISSPQPLFVIKKDTERNTLIVGSREELGQTTLTVQRVNWINGDPAVPIPAAVKIRYKAKALPATVTPLTADTAVVTFDDPVFGIAPGQGAVFYEGGRCLGGGIIAKSELRSTAQAIAQAIAHSPALTPTH